MTNSRAIRKRFVEEYNIPDGWEVYASEEKGTVEFVKGELGNETAAVDVTVGTSSGHITVFHEEYARLGDIPGKVADIEIEGQDETYERAVELLSEDAILDLAQEE